MKTTYKLLHILLLESNYKRAHFIDFDSGNIKNEIDIKINHINKEGQLDVTLKLTFISKQNENNVIEAVITMIGSFIFDTSEEVNIPVEAFATINAPAIIFPFIREHLANLTMKSGVQPVFLPPVNFIQLAKQAKNKQ